MKRALLLMVLVRMAAMQKQENSTAEDQLVDFKEKTKIPIGIITTSAGAAVEYTDATHTLNRRLIFNEYFMDTMTHFVREVIPERVVHAKGAGAFGYFQVTHNITDICRADLFSKVGKKTPVAVRFSPVAVERGGIDTSREPRGFSIKFYTKDGNFDIVGFNTPLFGVRDPLLFSALIKTAKRNPATNFNDANMFWDFLTLKPETLPIFLLIFGDRGIPDGYRYMPGYGIHTFQLVNRYGAKHFVRFHFTPDAGIRNLQSTEAANIARADPDYATRDLYNAIGTGKFPSWEVRIQVLTHKDVKNAKFDVFDVTKALPLNRYPLRPLGRFVLNKNPANFFADIEQLAFCPGNLVLGISGAPDKLFEARRFAYRDAQNYRLGTNFNKISVNCPLRAKVLAAYNRDGKPPVKDNYGGIPNYYPNSFNGPVPCKDPKRVGLIEIHEEKPDNFEEARDMYENEMTADERSRAIDNIVASLGQATPELQIRAVKLWARVHPDLGTRILAGLQGNSTQEN